MAAIDPESTTKVTAEKAVAAAANGAPSRARRERPATAQPTAAQVADQVAPAGSLAKAVAQNPVDLAGMDPATLTRVMQALGYGNQGPEVVAPDEGEGTTIELVASGVVRIPAPLPHQADTPRFYRLRPPLFGEHKTMRGALADALEAIDEATIDYQTATTAANAQKAEARQLPEGPDRSRAMLAAKRSQREADEAQEEAVGRIMAGWWDLVFDTVSLDGRPAEFGPWVRDHGLAAEIINHWRSSPRAPGR